MTTACEDCGSTREVEVQGSNGVALCEPCYGKRFRSPSKGSDVVERKESLPFRPITEALRDTPTEPEWIHRGYVAPGALTLLAAPPKAGKSTKIAAQAGAIERGEPFLDLATRQTGVLLLSEEREGTLAEKARRFDLSKRVEVLMRHEVGGEDWPAVIAAAAEHCHDHDLGVLIVDTWDKWAGLSGEQENSSGAVVEALYPLAKAAGEGLAVIIVTHQRKGGGRHGEAVRGSNALTGGVDVVVEMERLGEDAGPSARVLRSESRFSATPSELTIRLEGDHYQACGEVADLRADLEGRALRDAAEKLGEPATVEQLVAGAAESLGRELSAATARRRLDDLPDAQQSGRGVKGDPYLYSFSFHQGRTPRGGMNGGELPAAEVERMAEVVRAAARFGVYDEAADL